MQRSWGLKCGVGGVVLLLVSAVSGAETTGGLDPRGRKTVPVSGDAPRDGMMVGRWTSAIKDIFGTSYESYDSHNQYSNQSSTAPISNVWFTGAQGIVTEIYWPTLDVAQTRDSQFLVTDGKTFFSQERRDTLSKVEWLESGVPAFRVTNQDKGKRFTIERTIFSDPDSPVVYQRIKITRAVEGLKFYLLHNPAVYNTPMGDSAIVSVGDEPRAPGAGLFAWQEDQAQAVVFSVPLKLASASFSGPYDGFQDLQKDFKMDYHYSRALDGEVVMTAWLDLPETVGASEFVIGIGFGNSIQSAYDVTRKSMAQDLDQRLELYTSQWQGYQASIKDLSSASLDDGKLFRASVAVLKSMEDKTYEGAFVASPSVPWGEHTADNSSGTTRTRSQQYQTTGYHMVWPRDLYQMATTMMAIEDYPSAIAALNRLKAAQYSSTSREDEWSFSFRHRAKNGSFPQNFWVNGDPGWGGLQMDEVAMPVILAYKLWKAGRIDPSQYWDMVSRAADFIQGFGPWSPQERWEEVFGASPSTIASEISALWVAAEYALQMGDIARSNAYRATADAWNSKPGDNINTWLFTTSGGLGDGKYFVRVIGASSFEEVWNPNSDLEYYLANNAGRKRQKDVVDGGFLELVRFGVRSALDYHVLESLPEYDASIRVDVPGKGPGFRRYTGDRYNYDDVTGVQTEGMLWPLLTGERGHYELARAKEANLRPLQIDSAVVPYLHAMEAFATPSLMIPEQVWDFGPLAGQATGAATPLGWSHGEYLKLLRSRQDQKVFDQIPSVVQRAKELERGRFQGTP